MLTLTLPRSTPHHSKKGSGKVVRADLAKVTKNIIDDARRALASARPRQNGGKEGSSSRGGKRRSGAKGGRN
jgi:hypothetical protein